MSPRVLPVAFVMVVGCSADAVPWREPDEYVGCATDEHWMTFDESVDIVSEVEAPVLLAPVPGGSAPSIAFGFTWLPSPTATAALFGDVPPTCVQWNTGFARLHLPPISGTIYDLQLLVAGVSRHRVLTTLQGWRPSDALWASLSGQTLDIVLRRMVVLDNVPTAGPFIRAPSPSVTVDP